MAENDKKEVFISYCTKNKEIAQLFCKVVEGAGVSCWMAPRDIPPGGRWATAIQKGVEDATILALLVSDASMNSTEVEKEVDLANGSRKTILPLRIEEKSELKGAFKYHLSNKQWIEAFEEDPLIRFKKAIDAILQNLGIEASDGEKSGAGYLALAKILANELNQKHAVSGVVFEPRFSAPNRNDGIIDILFQFRLGANEADIICELNYKTRHLEVFVSKSTQLRPHIISFLNSLKPDFSCRINTDFHGNSYYKIAQIEPPFLLSPEYVELSEERLFNVFKDNVTAIFDKLMPRLNGWEKYGKIVSSMIGDIEIELKKVFPENEWIVGAPEGSRLVELRQHGKINVYKKSWQPEPPISTDNTNGRGLLSFTLEAGDALIGNLYIGILKNEPWYDLGDLNELMEKAKVIGTSGKPEDYWPWWQSLDNEWKYSGLATREWNWEEKSTLFVEYCIKKFTELKEFETTLDALCCKIPDLQIKPIDWFPLEKQKWENGLYVYNRLRIITESLSDIVCDAGFEVQFSTNRLQDHWIDKDVYLKLKIAEFDAVAVLKCSKKEMKVEFINLDPPDFETETIKAFIAARNSYTLAGEKVSNDYDGGSVTQWFDRFADFVKLQVEKLIPEFTALRQHLNDVVKLAERSGELLGESLGKGWMVDNKAKSLDKNEPINIWLTSWRNNGAKDDDLPPLMLQIIPTKPCFDALVISLRQNEQIAPQFEHSLGMVCGALEFAFGKGHDAKERCGIWSTTLPKHSITGGSSFDTPLIAGDEMSSFENHLTEIVKSIKRIESLISTLCSEHNEQVHFIGGMNNLIDGLTKSIEEIFPKNDGWKLTANAKTLERWASIRVFKETWKRTGYDPGMLTITVEAGQANFDDLCYGISDLGLFTDEHHEILRNKMKDSRELGNGKKSNNWPWYKIAEGNARWTGGKDKMVIDEHAQKDIQKFFRDKLLAIKTDVVPEIDKLLIGTSENAVTTRAEVKP